LFAAPTALSVSDGGTLLIATANADGGINVSSTARQGAVHFVTAVGRLGDMRFVGTGNGALIADAAKNVVWSVQDVTAGGSPQSIAAAANGVNSPVGVAASYDGRWAVIANPSGTILRVSLTQPASIVAATCACAPDRLASLSGNTTFQITASGPGPMWLYQGDLPAPRTVFVPAVSGAGAALRLSSAMGRGGL
jgi:hypothetical protein